MIRTCAVFLHKFHGSWQPNLCFMVPFKVIAHSSWKWPLIVWVFSFPIKNNDFLLLCQCLGESHVLFHRIPSPICFHVWNIHPQNWLIYWVNVGKYSSNIGHLMPYPPVIKHGFLENGTLISDFPSDKLPFSSRIFQLAMLDCQRVGHGDIRVIMLNIVYPLVMSK